MRKKLPKEVNFVFFLISLYSLALDIVLSLSLNSKYEINMIINGNPGICENKICNLNNDLNNITIRFNEEIKTCENMFYDLHNIIEIDLSNFDGSKVTNMHAMFYNCINLKKIIFGNFNTSSVEYMEQLFMNCNN